MWVLTEDGNLVNLDQAFDVLVDQQFGKQVVAYSPAIATYDRYNLTTLCSCDDEEHGKRIIQALAAHIHRRTLGVGHETIASMRHIAYETREGGEAS